MHELASHSDDHQLSLKNLPNSVIQSIYHAATGKTESLSRTLSENVIVNFDDILDLTCKLNDQLGIHSQAVDPTVTIITKHEGGKTLVYSSLERFNALPIGNSEPTSEVIVKIETVIIAPCTNQAQRIVITVSIDSALPLINLATKSQDSEASMFMLSFPKWETVNYKIDFVDFITAKNFADTIDVWFKNLKKQDKRKILFFKKFNALKFDRYSKSFGTSLSASLLIAIAIFIGPEKLNTQIAMISASFMVIINSLYTLTRRVFIDRIYKNSFLLNMPSVIILGAKDQECLDRLNDPVKNLNSHSIKLVSTIILNFFINIISSYFFVKFLQNSATAAP